MKKEIDLYKFEKELKKQGYKAICGVDEAGRGPLAGPVVAAAVILDDNDFIDGLNDSKKLSAKKREKLFPEIIEKAKGYSIKMIDHIEIDSINILQATFKAMRNCISDLDMKPDFILIDGDKSPYRKENPEIIPLKSGDALSATIAAASILAKVTRDRYMVEMSKIYLGYGFEKHKGYGTKMHYEMLDEKGISEIHRRSFLKKYYEQKK